jgi:hypothetical protein
MEKKKKQLWQPSDIFVIPLLDSKYAVGQILDQRIPNTLRIALFNEVLDTLETYDINHLGKFSHLIALLEVGEDQIRRKNWKIIGNKTSLIPRSIFPNEEYRSKNWVGSVTIDATVVDEFMNAFYALVPWDDWYDPEYLDGLLYDKNKKPLNLIYKNN